jgi:hypothetical protein
LNERIDLGPAISSVCQRPGFSVLCVFPVLTRVAA